MTSIPSNTKLASAESSPRKTNPAAGTGSADFSTNAGGLTHLTAAGEARMVDVGAKLLTRRTAKAQALVSMRPETARLILAGDLPKGDVLGTARLAGIMAAKRTHELIPLCHPLPLDSIDVQIDFRSPAQARIVATVRATWRTGVEMEALTAVSVAALTLYDMSKAVDKGMIIGPIALISKTGGKSGDFQADAPDLTPEQEE